ncbi:MAG: glycoside hydrolase family 99-like domain-containing protein [Oscillospiraceae bacterium]|jgi:hypothetical protein|nr:glycoside hydrolase family 99-like domain-containing protein [Oscillospiraceae bacterium]
MASFWSILLKGLRYGMAVVMFPVTALSGLLCRPAAAPPPLKLGAYYWDGWYEPMPSWTDRLLGEFADREPLWGWQSAGVANMEMQIGLAADSGLSFFAFDWYYPESGEINPMNNAVDRFLAAGNSDRMEFCLLVANHSGFSIYPDTWADAVERFLPYLTSDRALKVDGKPVIIFFSARELERCLGGEKQVRESLDYLRGECKKAGLPGCYVMGCTFAERTSAGDIDPCFLGWSVSALKNRAMGFDAVTGYNYHRATLPDGSWEYPFRRLTADYEKIWAMQGKYSLVKYMPVLNGGWDCRPWESGDDDPNRSCYSPDRSPAVIYSHVLQAAQWMKDYPDASAGGLALFYAWNEMGEGGYLLPTVGDDGAALQAIGAAMAAVRAASWDRAGRDTER